MILVYAYLRCDECGLEVKVKVNLRLEHAMRSIGGGFDVQHDVHATPWHTFVDGGMPQGWVPLRSYEGELCGPCEAVRKEREDRW